MIQKSFKVADHVFCITNVGEDILSLEENLCPFECSGEQEPLFNIHIDNSIQPSWRGTKVGTFPCPSAAFEVYRFDSGAYQILVMKDGDIPCAFIQSDDNLKEFSITTRGSSSDKRFGFSNALMVIFTICTSEHKTLLMHSSVVENNGKAYMFLGASGQGKSTHSDKWVEYIEGSTLINDDNPVLRIAPDGTPHIYGSPWSGKRPIYKNVKYPIGGMAAIEQDKENRMRRESVPVAFGILLSSCSTLKFDKKVHLDICATITAVLEQIPVHTLFCRPDEEAAQVSSKTFGL